jgi:hypothetical protein
MLFKFSLFFFLFEIKKNKKKLLMSKIIYVIFIYLVLKICFTQFLSCWGINELV